MRHNAPHVLATTGLPHALIMALTPGDIDWDGRRVLAHPRRKGTGTAKVWLPVSAVAIKALRAFDAWGDDFEALEEASTTYNVSPAALVPLPASPR